MLSGTRISLVAAVLVTVTACKTQGPVDMEAAMGRMMELGQTGAHHEHLARMVGDWDCQMSYWMEAGAEPGTMNGTSRYAMILDGHYQEQTFRGDWEGQPFEGRGLMGYDTAKGQYWLTWMDNFSTFMMPPLYGSCMNDGQEIHLEGDWYNPFVERNQHERQVLKWIDANHFTFDAYTRIEGEDEHPSMHIDFRRR